MLDIHSKDNKGIQARGGSPDPQRNKSEKPIPAKPHEAGQKGGERLPQSKGSESRKGGSGSNTNRSGKR